MPPDVFPVAFRIPRCASRTCSAFDFALLLPYAAFEFSCFTLLWFALSSIAFGWLLPVDVIFNPRVFASQSCAASHGIPNPSQYAFPLFPIVSRRFPWLSAVLIPNHLSLLAVVPHCFRLLPFAVLCFPSTAGCWCGHPNGCWHRN